MTRSEAYVLAHTLANSMPSRDRRRLKSIDVLPRLHKGMLTIRCYFINEAAEEPESYIFNAEDL